MKVYVAYDGGLRVRIGHENLGSESLGPWYGGTGAVRLRQVHDGWFWAYVLDGRAYRGTAKPSGVDFERVREHLPSARVVTVHGDRTRNLDVQVSDADLAMLQGRVVPLNTRVARFGTGMVAMFGDFQIDRTAGASLGLFHLGANRFNAFRTGFRYTAMDGGDIGGMVARLPSARLRRGGDMSVVEADDADLATLLGMAEEER